MDANKQKEVLKNFILEFLPEIENERKYSTNKIVMVKRLRNVTKKLQPNTCQEKEYKYYLLKSRLEDFKIKHGIS